MCLIGILERDNEEDGVKVFFKEVLDRKQFGINEKY